MTKKRYKSLKCRVPLDRTQTDTKLFFLSLSLSRHVCLMSVCECILVSRFFPSFFTREKSGVDKLWTFALQRWKIASPRNAVSGEITKYYFYRTLSIYEYGPRRVVKILCKWFTCRIFVALNWGNCCPVCVALEESFASLFVVVVVKMVPFLVANWKKVSGFVTDDW